MHRGIMDNNYYLDFYSAFRVPSGLTINPPTVSLKSKTEEKQ